VILEQIARIGAPYALCALAGVYAERSGVIDIALEGKLLFGAFSAAVVSLATGSAALGLGAGLAGAMLLAALQALATVRLRANHVVVGVALNLFAAGVTRFLLHALYGSSSNSPRLEHVLSGSLYALTAAAIVLAHLVLGRTVFGLRLRAAGEHPVAASSLGVSVRRIRFGALMIGGALAGLAGTFMAHDQRGFVDLMSGGRGFIAIAALIIGRWRPIPAVVAALGFAAVEAGEIHLQSMGLPVPSALLNVLPHALTVIVLAGFVGRQTAPRALGSPSPD
jgi:simple sugar transport system permease protein